MKPDSSESLVRAVRHFFSGTMLSRLSGMGRDMIMAYVFGSNPVLAAFLMSFRFSNLLRRVFGEGAMQSAFIPHFESLRSENPSRAAVFFKDLSALITCVLLGFTVLLEVCLWQICERADLSSSNQEIVKLTALMFPGIIFICLYGLNISLLQCNGRFFLSSVAPVAFNSVWMISALLLQGFEQNQAMKILSLCIVLAYFFQWLMTLPYVWKFLKESVHTKWFSSFRFFSKDIKSLLGPLLLGIIGVSASQVNSSLDPIFARAADLEGPAFLWYALRIQQLPLALLGIAFSGALLPSLSRAVKNQDRGQFNHLFLFGLKRILSLMIPITFLFFAVGSCSVLLLFGRKDFSDRAIQETTLCLWGYALGLVPMTVVLLLSAAFYAKNDFKKSATASLFSMIVNALLNSLFVFVLGMSSASVAFATSIAACFNCLLMSTVLEKESRIMQDILSCFLKVFVASFVACLVTLLIGYVLADPTLSIILFASQPHFERSFSSHILSLIIQVLSFCMSFIGVSFLISSKEVMTMLSLKKMSLRS